MLSFLIVLGIIAAAVLIYKAYLDIRITDPSEKATILSIIAFRQYGVQTLLPVRFRVNDEKERKRRRRANGILLVFYASFLMILLLSLLPSSSGSTATKNKGFAIDPAIKDTVLRHIKSHSNKHFASFETPAELGFFSIETGFHMTSWYSAENDTVDLVAHVGEFETQALLIRFLHGKPVPYYLRAPHLVEKYFRLTETDSFSNQVEVSLASYDLRLSAIPDTIQKPLVFGSIDMESGTYYDKRDSSKSTNVRMKFYFFSQFRRFDYPW